MNKALLAIFLLLPLSGYGWDDNSLDLAWRSHDLQPLQQASANSDFRGWYAHYRMAMLALDNDDKKQAKASLDILKNALKNNYQSTDEAALYSMSLGLTIALKPWQAAFIAGSAEDSLQYCKDQPDEHPACYLVEGTAQFNTPSLLGGDKVEALNTFEKAIALYTQEESWGYEDALLWKVKTLIALERLNEARSARQELLTLFPDFLDAQRLEF